MLSFSTTMPEPDCFDLTRLIYLQAGRYERPASPGTLGFDCVFPSVANLSVVALLFNSTMNWRPYISEVQNAADSLGISLQVVNVGSPDQLQAGFSEIANSHAQAVLLTPDGMFWQQRTRIADLAIAHRIPTIGWMGDIAEAGALVSYGADTPDLFRKAATYIDKILKGASPADLPIEQPDKFEFIINLKTAKALAGC